MVKPTPKLFGAKQYALAFGSGLIGVSFALFRQHSTNGKLTLVDIGVSLLSLAALGLIVVLVARLANRTEK